MQELARLLGSPQESYPSIHVTGTNGKGSTATMASNLLQSLGLHVGTYTSPNLSRVNERLSLDSRPIEDASFLDLLEVLAAADGSMAERATRFELLTGAAFRWFSDEAVDVAVVEVGLGGSWDSTNVMDGQVAVLTNVSYDHTDVLGPTLEGIAQDKSGIIKEGCTVVIGDSNPELIAIMERAASDVGAAAVWVRGRDFDCTENRVAVGGRLVGFRTPGGRYVDVLVPLHGRHQGVNAVCALAAVEAFIGAPISEAVLSDAFASVSVPGRMEVVGRRPLCIVDGAHNVAGMTALSVALQEEFNVDGASVAVVGMLGGRDPLAMLQPLKTAGVELIVACAPRSPRALSPETVAEAARAVGLRALTQQSVTAAMSTARTELSDDGLLLATGSLYVVAEARSHLLDAVRSPD
ncbi:MAG: bifunctional folylpolyglutamate synthase/dihydrofolate synthase [Acidimicrobiales bacterium]